MLTLKDKIALVTGSAQGIGKAIAEKFADAGAHIVISDVNDTLAAETAAEIAKKGVETLALKCDVTEYTSVEEQTKKIVDKFGRIDIVVNNAGVTRDTLMMRMKPEDFDFVININLKGVFNVSKSVAMQMARQRYGRIINIASISGIIGNPGQANYAASKGGVIALTKTIAKEYCKRGVTANAVAPGFIQTAMTDKLPERAIDAYLKAIPLARLGSVEDVAHAALFLASDEAGYITGQTLTVDGGLTLVYMS